MEQILLHINGEDREVSVNPSWTLLYVLREVMDLTGTKCGCNTGDCGACKVIIDSRAVQSCLIRAVNAVGKNIETIEGLSDGYHLHPIQQAFVDCGAVQCGYCTPGMIMAAKALLDANPHPSEEEIRLAIKDNFCRCSGYVEIVRAIQYAARLLEEEKSERL